MPAPPLTSPLSLSPIVHSLPPPPPLPTVRLGASLVPSHVGACPGCLLGSTPPLSLSPVYPAHCCQRIFLRHHCNLYPPPPQSCSNSAMASQCPSDKLQPPPNGPQCSVRSNPWEPFWDPSSLNPPPAQLMLCISAPLVLLCLYHPIFSLTPIFYLSSGASGAKARRLDFVLGLPGSPPGPCLPSPPP